MENTKLTDKVVMVTGGAKDAGAAIVELCHARGAKIALVDTDEIEAQKLVDSINERGGQAFFIGCDVSDKFQVKRTFEKISDCFSGLDFLINLAGPYRPLDPLDEWEYMVQSNLLGTLYTTRCAIDRMKASGGSIVNVASDSGLGFGPEQQPAYGAAKAGVMRLTAALKFLSDDYAIRVNCLVPDWIGTKAVMSWTDSMSASDRLANHVPNHITTVQEFAEATLDLATRPDYAGRIVLYWSGKPLEVIDYGDRGYVNVSEF